MSKGKATVMMRFQPQIFHSEITHCSRDVTVNIRNSLLTCGFSVCQSHFSSLSPRENTSIKVIVTCHDKSLTELTSLGYQSI